MWAHYADSHAGFAVDLAAGEEGNFEGFVIRGMGTGLVAAKVKYPRSFDQISFASDGSNVLEVCWSKHPLWEYEEEWRVTSRHWPAQSHTDSSRMLERNKARDSACRLSPRIFAG